jgi:hypothetical protein
LCRFKRLEDLAGFGEQHLPGLGQRHRMPGSLEQLGVQASLKGPHGSGQRGLSERDLSGRPGKAQFLGDGNEVPKLAKLQHGDFTLTVMPLPGRTSRPPRSPSSYG